MVVDRYRLRANKRIFCNQDKSAPTLTDTNQFKLVPLLNNRLHLCHSGANELDQCHSRCSLLTGPWMLFRGKISSRLNCVLSLCQELAIIDTFQEKLLKLNEQIGCILISADSYV